MIDTRSIARTGRHLLVAALFVLLAVCYVHPLFDALFTRVASDPYDPLLNATILWWNATVTPFTAAWWNQPQFHPATGITGFTETLVGLWPLSTPIFWLTGSPLATYNLVFVLSVPLSALGGYFLVYQLTRRVDASLLGGLAFGFSPYRTAEIGHLQSLCAFGLPVALGALHAHVADGRRRWLVLFGTAWLLQSLTNGYYLLFGGVLIALWLAYFCSSAATCRAGARILLAWALASVPLLPVLLRYRQIHDVYGLHRQFFEAVAFSAHPESWFQVSGYVRAWRGVLPQGSDDLFPGLVAPALVVMAVVAAAWRPRAPDAAPPSWHRRAATLAAATFMLSAAALLVMLQRGPWTLESGGHAWFRMADPYRALLVAALSALALFTWSTRLRAAWRRRHALVFYAATTLVMAVLACGPVLSAKGYTIIDPAPYRWLMLVPGFDQVRVPMRFWMPGVLALAAAAGVAFALITARWRARSAWLACAVCAAGILTDGWVEAMPMAVVPAVHEAMRDDQPGAAPILYLPLGPDWDSAATFDITAHHRRVVNGVSGYDPPFYAPLQDGLRERVPDQLRALASLGAFDVAVDPPTDADGAWRAYAASAPGATPLPEANGLARFHVPAGSFEEGHVGRALHVQGVTSSRGEPAAAIDGRLDTGWVDAPQHPRQWLQLDLGAAEAVGGVSLAVLDHAYDFPRHLAVDLSDDGVGWRTVFDEPAAPRVFLAVQRDPRTAWLRVPFAASTARYVRVRQTAASGMGWRVTEVEVNAPAP